ncbi:MAG: hypothetical protein GEU80_05900 [Dehalococcoidia bacterium]|nr:hypothetical protein [Dehalococcoidia bacterium]
MRSLSSLIHSSRDSNELARSLEAVLESGMVIAVRDSGGRFVQSSRAYGQALGTDEDVRGNIRLEGQRFFSPDGRELPLREHPSHIARTTGEPQRNVLIGVRRAAAEAWFKISYMPVDRGPEGWSTLSIGADITAEWTRMRAAEVDAARGRQLVDLALRVAGRRSTPERIAGALVETIAASLGGTSLYLLIRDQTDLRVIAVRNAFGPRIDATSTSVPLTDEDASRWYSGVTHVNLDVRDTDVYGGKVAMEWMTKPGSLVIVPVPNPAGEAPRAALVASAEAHHAFTTQQIEALEQAAQLISPALDFEAPAAVAA